MTQLPFWSDGAMHVTGLHMLLLIVFWLWFGYRMVKRGSLFGYAFGLAWFVALPYAMIGGFAQ